jgi:hypothetical protein
MMAVDLPAAADPDDDEPPAYPGGLREFDLPEQPPGNPGWMRAFAETTAAQRVPFADGVERLPTFDPVYWHGTARDRFAAARDRLVEQWKTVLDTHDEVRRRVDGHNAFVHQLQHLWESDRHDPPALRHTSEVHRRAAADLSATLLAAAAELDAVALDAWPAPEPREAVGTAHAGHRPSAEPKQTEGDRRSEPEPTLAPQPDAPPDPQPPDPQPQDPEPPPDATPQDADLATNGHVGDPVQPVTVALDVAGHEAPTTPAHRYQLTEKLGEQLLTGVRQYRIVWEGARR